MSWLFYLRKIGNMFRRLFIFITLSGSLTACSIQKQTLEEYWYGQGERLGRNGYQYNSETLKILKEKTPFKEIAYKEGYETGWQEFCDPYRAFEKGVQGKLYVAQCDGHPKEIMIKADWERGWQAFVSGEIFSVK